MEGLRVEFGPSPAIVPPATVYRRMNRHLVALLALVALLGAPSLVHGAAPPRASLPDIEDEVMCPTCGVPLNQAFSPQAERERAFIRAEIARGKTKGEIKQELERQFGAEVLALPDTGDSGFNWAAYLVPVVAIMVAAAALAIGLRRWRRRPPAPAGPPPPAPSDAESARLEQDLSRYDV
jgi:cytochrome c-type biogenesis protein CcmH/NrfF